jgi:hypothetical protein
LPEPCNIVAEPNAAIQHTVDELKTSAIDLGSYPKNADKS